MALSQYSAYKVPITPANLYDMFQNVNSIEKARILVMADINEKLNPSAMTKILAFAQTNLPSILVSAVVVGSVGYGIN